jgi:hypothetical protein
LEFGGIGGTIRADEVARGGVEAMSKTAFYANMIKDQLEKLEPSPKEHDPVHTTVTYLLYRLWPDLESAIKEELPDR